MFRLKKKGASRCGLSVELINSTNGRLAVDLSWQFLAVAVHFALHLHSLTKGRFITSGNRFCSTLFMYDSSSFPSDNKRPSVAGEGCVGSFPFVGPRPFFDAAEITSSTLEWAMRMVNRETIGMTTKLS